MVDNIELLEAKQEVENVLLSQTGSFAGVGASSKEDTVNIYLREYSEQAKQKAYELIGSTKANGHEISFISSGNVSALQAPAYLNRTAYSRPLYGGMSIGHSKIGAGTLGVVCYDASSKEKRLLTNNHVAASSSSLQSPQANIGDVIYAPGCLDTLGCIYPIGKLAKYVPFDETATNFVDCAIVTPDNPTDVSEEIIGIGSLTGYTEPKEGLHVKKSGRTTSVTDNTINDIAATIEVDYGGKIIKLTNCIVTGMMASAGDSGSCLVTDDNKAVGLLFAGSDTITIHNRITYVMSQLGVLMTPYDTSPAPQEGITPGSVEYQVQTLGIVALGVGAAIGLLPVIEQQLQLMFHMRT